MSEGGAAAAGRDVEQQLAHIAEISRNARTTWFALLVLLAFVGVTMMAHKDADFFAAGVSTELPVIGIDVPTVSFFIAAPFLLAAIYSYFHMYLISLWDEIAAVPARIGPDRLFDRVLPNFITQSAVLYRAKRSGDGSADIRAFSTAMQWITFLLVWAMTPLLLAFVFYRSTAYHSPLLSLWIGLGLVVAGAFGFEGFRVARGRLSAPNATARRQVHAPWPRAWRFSVLRCGLAMALVAWLFTSGFEPVVRWVAGWNPNHPPTDPAVWRLGARPEYERVAALARTTVTAANFAGAELTERPDDWRSYDHFMEDFEKAFRDREGLDASGPLGEKENAFNTEALARYKAMIAGLSSPDLAGVDLRAARGSGAFLPGADLVGAEMQGADLSWAEMQGADLSEAKMQGANLWQAEMQGANLFGAEMQGADLIGAEMQGADLGGAKMQGANLGVAKMRGADLSRAEMQGANLPGAKMQGADLFGAKMQGADLSVAAITSAECRVTRAQGVALHSAALLCSAGSLSQFQINYATGNARTRLPKGLALLECLPMTEERLPAWLLEAIALHGDQPNSPVRINAEEFLDRILCEPGQIPDIYVGSWVELPDGSWRDENTGLTMVKQPDGSWEDVPPDTAQ